MDEIGVAMITPEQLRAARGLLDWSRGDLSKACGISQETVKNIERGVFRPQEATEKAILKAFAAHDVCFLDADGVRKKTEPVKVFKGEEELKAFFDSLYESAKSGADICAFCIDEKSFAHHLGDYAKAHFQRMGQLNGTRIRCLARGNGEEAPSAPYGECRAISADKFFSVPFFICGGRLAFVLIDSEKAFVARLSVQPVAEAYRKQFDALWGKATSPLQAAPDEAG